MTYRVIIYAMILAFSVNPTFAKGKLAGSSGGNEREAVVYSAEKGLEAWTITGPSGNFEFTLEPGEYMVSCGGRLAPYVRIRDGQTTRINHSNQPKFSLESELWTPSCLSFGQTYTATGTAFTGLSFWIPGGSTRMKLSLREDGPEGKLIGEHETSEEKTWITGINVSQEDFPTTPGKVYYLEIASLENKPWAIAVPRKPDVYPGGVAFYDGVAHPESDLGLTINESIPGPVRVAAAKDDQHFIESGPGSGTCTVAGQSFRPGKARNIISVYVNCGFQGIQDFIYTIYEGGPDGKVITSKNTRMVANWGTTAYFQPHEVTLEPDKEYYLEYKRVDGEPFFSYLSSDVYPDGKAYRDGKEVEGFDQLFEIVGEIEPGGLTYPYNIQASELTPTSARISWETGPPSDGIVYYGEDQTLKNIVANESFQSTNHAALLAGLKPGTTYYYRVTSTTGKAGGARTWGHMGSFMTPPEGGDSPQFDKPETPRPVPALGPKNVPVVNGSFEDGLKGWQVSWFADPRDAGDFVMPDGPYGKATTGDHGYKPYSGKTMYGWHHLKIDMPELPGEIWKQDVVHQRIRVEPGAKYVLKAWLLTGDRGSGWGGDARARLVVDAKGSGLLNKVETAAQATATQWFATRNEWIPVSLHFTAEKNTADIGVHLFQWFTHEASYLYVDNISVERVD